jgi:hypothetical protein
MTPTLRFQRGSALLVAVIAIGVLMVLVMGAIQFTGSNRQAAVAKARGDRTASCAENARRYVLSKLDMNRISSAISFDEPLLDDTDPTHQSRLITGHYGAPESATIRPMASSSAGASRRQVRDMSNVIADPTLGGTYFRVVVKCREKPTDREQEVEFAFRYGL